MSFTHMRSMNITGPTHRNLTHNSPATRTPVSRICPSPSNARVSLRVCAAADTEVEKRAAEGGAINKLTVFLNNSPINKGKIWLAKKQAGEYDVEEVQGMMAEQIEDNDVLVYSFSTCPFCKKAKAALEEENIEYTAYELDQMGKEGYQIRAELAELTGRTSMPNIFIGGNSIGGCNDGTPGLMPLIASGELELLLPSKPVPVQVVRGFKNPFANLKNPFAK
eukprot:CAMPEP_0114261846 /NCGR_PEP_ID=MMETSP0058-20121206/21392_1 /TAXON_ID=36894 /ORGANISM="Pyramimonas parkeae, CCMP726" /LENGTH=221 /DNA_ID=CAMNT_0001377483 /DNA_START=77 /DNA_END=742 /DNA_ORIENTATION=+